MTTKYIHEGNRYISTFRLINTTVFNAFVFNTFFDKNLNIKDIDKTIKTIIFKQYDSPNTFWKEKQSDIIKSTYKIYQDTLEYLKSNTILDLYYKICKDLDIKPKLLYTPHDFTLTEFFMSYKDELNSISSRRQRMMFLEQLANYDKDLFHKLKSIYNKKKSLLTPCINDGNYKPTTYRYLTDEYGDGVIFIETKNEQQFCCRNHLKYQWKQSCKQSNTNTNNSNFVFKSFNNNTPLLLLLNNKIQIQNRLKLKTVSVDDLKYYNCMIYSMIC